MDEEAGPARRKYPRTPHLPSSPGFTADDIRVCGTGFRMGHVAADVVATVKMDGENTTVLADGSCHARSLDSAAHPSRTWMRAFAATVGPQLPAGWRLCGENLYARHSIGYDDLRSYFYGFGIYDDTNRCLDWDTTLEWFELLGVTPVEVFWRGPFDSVRIHAEFADRFDLTATEGYVVRTVAGFAYDDFADHVAKWVRSGHVQTDTHWMHGPVVPNRLASDLD